MTGREHVRRHVARHRGVVADERVGADLAELVGAGIAAHDHPVTHLHMSAEHDQVGQHDVIADLCGLLESNGVKVFTPMLASEGFFGLSVAEDDMSTAVIVNVWDRLSVERWLFTAARELGHLVLHPDAYDAQETGEDEREESEADTFASHFLMPEDLFQRELRAARGLALVPLVFKLKRLFRASWQSVLYRIVAHARDPRRTWSQFHRGYEALTGRSIEAPRLSEVLAANAVERAQPRPKVADEPAHLLPSDFVISRLRRLIRTALQSDAISTGRAAEILGIELVEMRDLQQSWLALR